MNTGQTGDDTLFGLWLRKTGLRALQKGLMRTMQQVALAVMVATGLALAGCGGGSPKPAGVPPVGGEPIPPTSKSLDLSSFDDAAIMAGTLDIAPGESETLGGLTYSCPAGGVTCMVTVGDDKTATYTGGMPTVMVTPPDDETPPDDGTPSTGGAPPSGGTPPATTTPSLDVDKLFAALEDRILGVDQNNRKLSIDQEWDFTSAMHGKALGLKIYDEVRDDGDDGDLEFRGEIPVTSVKLPALHGWAGTRATGSDARYEHTLVLYSDLEAPALDGTADDRYTYFGWWLRKDKQNGALAFRELAGGWYWDTEDEEWYAEDPVPVTAGVTGTATYSGAGAGMYALKREGQTDEAGEWTGKATVTAAFGDGTAIGTVTGTITEFMVGGQSRNWKVDLEQFDINYSSGYGRTAWSIDGVKSATPITSKATWVNFFNNNKGTPGGANSQPTSLYGRFSAYYGTEGEMDGAFGAHK